ncbi:MAG: hypothetical protein IKN38_04100 [Clostridia bacterium]|nr:hypothetical protein [Clostridia bacterium]
MNKEQQTKNAKGIFFTCTAAEKRKIKSIAERCGLGQGEYILQRALGYEPKTVPPNAFFVFHDKLCEILDAPPTPETEKAALRVFDEIYTQLVDNRRQGTEEIQAELESIASKAADPSDRGDGV